MKCLLASKSPRRKEILETLGIGVITRPAGVDEAFRPGLPIGNEVERLALEKAETLGEIPDGLFGLGADTVVVVEEEILGKPGNPEEAAAMLERLSGRWHRVITGIALRHGEESRSAHTVTQVRMAPLSRQEIAWYVSTGEPLDKAGAYGIQGAGGLFVTEIRGSYSNVVGLPIHTLYGMMKGMGIAEAVMGNDA